MRGGGSHVVAVVSAMAVALSAACSGGGSMGSEGAPPGAGAGGAGGSGGAAGGGNSAGVGGVVMPITGGAAGTLVSTGGTGGVVCPKCPEAPYGLLLQGDGDDLRMEENESSSLDSACPGLPLLGSRAGCGGTGVYFSACEARGGACLEVSGFNATYRDRTGTVWTGSAAVERPDTPGPAGTDQGTLALMLTSGSSTLALTATFVFCASGSLVRVVCR